MCKNIITEDNLKCNKCAGTGRFLCPDCDFDLEECDLCEGTGFKKEVVICGFCEVANFIPLNKEKIEVTFKGTYIRCSFCGNVIYIKHNFPAPTSTKEVTPITPEEEFLFEKQALHLLFKEYEERITNYQEREELMQKELIQYNKLLTRVTELEKLTEGQKRKREELRHRYEKQLIRIKQTNKRLTTLNNAYAEYIHNPQLELSNTNKKIQIAALEKNIKKQKRIHQENAEKVSLLENLLFKSNEYHEDLMDKNYELLQMLESIKNVTEESS